MSLSAYLGKLLLSQKQTAAPATGAGWQRLPGGRLELRDTGYAIQLTGVATEPPYRLFDPDGRPLANGYLLQALKEYGEQMARDRAEFGP